MGQKLKKVFLEWNVSVLICSEAIIADFKDFKKSWT